MSDASTRKYKKLALFVMSFKGGSGKTTFSRSTVATCRELGVPMLAYDCDGKVHQLSDFEGLRDASGRYDAALAASSPEKSVSLLDIRKKVDRARIADALDLDEDFMIFDLPGGSVDEMKDVFGDIDSFKEEFRAMGYEIGIAFVVNSLLASCAAIPEVVKIWGDVRYLVVKNGTIDAETGLARPFRFFDGVDSARAGNPAALIKNMGGQVFDMPRLDEDTYDLIDADQMPLALAKSETMRPAGYLPAEPYKRADRGRVRKFLALFEERLRALDLIPGLSTQTQ